MLGASFLARHVFEPVPLDVWLWQANPGTVECEGLAPAQPPLSTAPQGHGGVGGGGAGGQADHGGSRALPGRTGCADPNLKTDKKI